ncbi:hypothetical protein L1987_84558 [Smallanthus sonchifolius]|uniref:Uncharacterized protein n=1 Tax=Smallanthus sonchifolius TaxID=185202 RepID=A0ACB8YG63_9ASTR|nr:hypothetical protein L1987_84558 [Smallanthus sonchifolius]
MVSWNYKLGREVDHMYPENRQDAGKHKLRLKKMSIIFKILRDNGNMLMGGGAKRGGGWDLSCCIGRVQGWAGTKCTLPATRKSEERSSKIGMLRQLSNPIYSTYVLLFYRCNRMAGVADHWCMGSETCMQYTTRGINGEGAGTLHSQNTTFKREECLCSGCYLDVHMANGRSGIEVHQLELDRKTNLWTGKKRVKQRRKSNAWFYLWSYTRGKTINREGFGCVLFETKTGIGLGKSWVRVSEVFMSEKQKQLIANKGDTIAKSLHRSFEESNSDMQNDGKDVWDKLCMRLIGVKWPDPWCQPLAPDCANNLWSLALQREKASWMKQGKEVCSGLYTDIIQQLTQQEEAIHRKKKKKQKSKGKNPFNNMHGKELEHDTNEGGTMHGDDTRKKHKIWFSRNRRPAKNLSVQKIIFSQEAIPANASLNLMGMGEFKIGHAKTKDSISKNNLKESHMSRMDNLFEDLMARRVKLKEIASNINTTDENKMLVNSLLAMKSYKVLKFSAKKNEAGQVTIDENMVEVDKGPDTHIATHIEGPQSTYANMLTEEIVTENNSKEVNHNMQNARLNQPKPPDNDGFTTVTRRKGTGGMNNKPRGPLAQNKYTQVHEGRSGHQRNNAEPGGIIYERNIVNRPTRSEPPVSGIKNNQESKQESINQPRHNNPQGISKKINGGTPNKPRVHTNEEKEPTIELIETSNRFCLLDNDGNELPSIQERMYQQTSANTNERWRMKQERLINIKYMQLVTKEQRYEVKRYIIDRLVPLDSSLSEWSKPMIEYFRHLCSIYEFGAGNLAATHERMNMIDTSSNDHENVEMLIEEVESEEDGTAEMMKSDSPSTPNTSRNKEEGMEVRNPTDMLVGGTKAGDN